MRARLVRALPWLAALAVAGALLSPFYQRIDAISLNDDWTQIFAFNAFLRDSLLTDGELPQRSPWLGGGFPILGHPEYPVISPLTVPTLAFGPIVGVKLAAGIIIAGGLLGMWLLCRRTLGLAPPAALYATATYGALGWTTAILESGNYPQLYVLWLPLWIALTADGARWLDGKLIAAAALGTTALLDGHLNTVVTLLVAAGLVVLLRPVAWRRVLVLAGLTAGLAAYKLAPTIALLRLGDRALGEYATAHIEVSAFDPAAFVGLRCRPDGFALGPLPWLLALGSLVALRKSWRWLVLLALAALLYAGPHAPIDLFWLLTRLPVLRSIDAPSKYFVFYAGFAVLLLGAIALDGATDRSKVVLGWLAAVGAAVPLIIAGRPALSATFTEPDVPATRRAYEPLDTAAFESPWTGPPALKPDLYVYYRRGIALVRWEDNFRLKNAQIAGWSLDPTGVLTKNDAFRGAAWLDGAGTVTTTALTANTVRASVTTPAPSLLVFDQNGADSADESGWACRGGTLTAASRLSVAVPAGTTEVECRYRSRPFQLGVTVSVATGMSLIGWGIWRRRARGRVARELSGS